MDGRQSGECTEQPEHWLTEKGTQAFQEAVDPSGL